MLPVPPAGGALFPETVHKGFGLFVWRVMVYLGLYMILEIDSGGYDFAATFA